VPGPLHAPFQVFPPALFGEEGIWGVVEGGFKYLVVTKVKE